jgi:Domain of unknown function (DUF4936)
MPEAAAGAPELFIYYRVPVAAEAPLREAVVGLQRGLCAAYPGLQARLLRRPELRAGELTFMEVYARPAVGIDAHLQAAIEQAALTLGPWLSGGRHTEVFHPCA